MRNKKNDANGFYTISFFEPELDAPIPACVADYRMTS